MVTRPPARYLRRMLTDSHGDTYVYSFDPWFGAAAGGAGGHAGRAHRGAGRRHDFPAGGPQRGGPGAARRAGAAAELVAGTAPLYATYIEVYGSVTHAGEPVESFRLFGHVNSWNSVSDDKLVVRTIRMGNFARR